MQLHLLHGRYRARGICCYTNLGPVAPPPVAPAAPAQPAAPVTQGGVQFTSGTSTNSGNQTANTTANTNQANTYTAAQQGLQGGAINALQNTLTTGGTPNTANYIPQQMQAYTDYYNQYVAPQEAAQGGSGSPAIGSNLAMGLEQLQGTLANNLYNTDASVYSNALGTASGTAFTPTGQNQAANTNSNSNYTDNSIWQTNNSQVLGAASAIPSVLGLLGG